MIRLLLKVTRYFMALFVDRLTLRTVSRGSELRICHTAFGIADRDLPVQYATLLGFDDD